MIARLAIIQRYNANYYYTIQTLTDVYSMDEPYTEFSASLFIVSFEFAGFSRHSLPLYKTKQTNCIIQSSRFGHPPIRLFQFLQRFQSYLFNFENKKAETSRVETGRDEAGREDCSGQVMFHRVVSWLYLFRCGRGVRPWMRDEVHTVG